jgi:segregation and condensation protein B
MKAAPFARSIRNISSRRLQGKKKERLNTQGTESGAPFEAPLELRGKQGKQSSQRKANNMTNEERKAALEAIIYAADEPATIDQLATALGEEKLVVQASLDELVASYAAEEHGVEVRAVAGGYKMYTKPQQHDAVRRFIKSLRPPLRLTMPALETLAVIAYKQPVTAPEIQEIRGVNTSGVLKTLLDKRLITTAGRKEVIGRPILYRSSKEFLMRFGLSDLDELPSLKEFEALAREALGSDEGFAPSGAGDESVLDGMPRSGAEIDAPAERPRQKASQMAKRKKLPRQPLRPVTPFRSRKASSTPRRMITPVFNPRRLTRLIRSPSRNYSPRRIKQAPTPPKLRLTRSRRPESNGSAGHSSRPTSSHDRTAKDFCPRERHSRKCRNAYRK